MPDTREVIIRIDLGSRHVEIWAEDRGWQGRLERLGFERRDQQGKGAWYRGTPEQIRLKGPPVRQAAGRREASLAGLAAAREAQRRLRAGMGNS
jgi:hypothetical protein